VDCRRCSALADRSFRRFEAATEVAQYMPAALRSCQRRWSPPRSLRAIKSHTTRALHRSAPSRSSYRVPARASRTLASSGSVTDPTRPLAWPRVGHRDDRVPELKVAPVIDGKM